MIVIAVWKPSFAPSIKASYTLIFFRVPLMINPQMMVKRSVLANKVEYKETCSCSMELNNQTNPPINNPNPPKNNTRFRCKILIFCRTQTAKIATKVDVNVASMIGRNISDGFAAPICARYIMMVIGIKVSPEALMQRNMTIELLADSFLGFNFCNCCIAFSPIGVAALSSPSKFAERFMKIDPVTGWSFGISGNSLLNTGAASRANAWITPPFSPIFIIPSQSDKIPVSPKEISKPVLAEAKEALIISVKTVVSPPITSLPTATTKAIRKKAIQI